VRTVGVRYSVPAARWVGGAPLPAHTGTVVFERRTDSGTADLYTVGADGMRLRRLTSGGLSFDPAWSPDGDRIAFTGGHVVDRELYSMNADGTGRLRLTSFLGSAWVGQPSWYRDPTGLRILFTRQLPRAGGGDLYGIGSDGLASIPLLETPDPEADGSLSAAGRLAYELRGAVWIREAGAARRLGPGTQPQWSPDGTRLVVVREPGLHGGTIGVVGAGGSGFRAVGFGTDPAWSPDGTTIVYGTQSGLFRARADGAGQPRRLTRAPRLTLDLSPSWRTG
jgi:Tol biopolymer transport system component